MIRARLFEKYIKSSPSAKLNQIEREVLEERLFSSKEKFYQWYDTFKEELWEDDPDKVSLVEGVYVEMEEVQVDVVDAPMRTKHFATFRPGVSYNYAV